MSYQVIEAADAHYLHFGETWICRVAKHEGEYIAAQLNKFAPAVVTPAGPIPMILTCPMCGQRHIDEGAFETKVHHTHSCQTCGMTWRPTIVATVGVRFLPGFKSDPEKRDE